MRLRKIAAEGLHMVAWGIVMMFGSVFAGMMFCILVVSGCAGCAAFWALHWALSGIVGLAPESIQKRPPGGTRPRPGPNGESGGPSGPGLGRPHGPES